MSETSGRKRGSPSPGATDKFIENLLKEFERCVPKPSLECLKGTAGRVAVIGGSLCYTGAPYFAAMAALRAGADLAYIFTSSSAGVPIKCYSPELIVYPILEKKTFVSTFEEKCGVFTSVIIGPGLGRPGESMTQDQFNELVECLKVKKVPMVIDADGLLFVSKNVKTVVGYKEAILTPNCREFKRLYAAVYEREYPGDPTNIDDNELKSLATKLGNVTIICKNMEDKVTDGTTLVSYNRIASPRRCGGQGDILCGFVATFMSWAMATSFLSVPSTLAASIAASILTRRSARLAFNKHHRSTLATNILEEIPGALKEMFPRLCTYKD